MKNNLSIILSLLALVIDIAIIALWACNVGGFSVVTLDSFVGVVVTLLSILVTFVVGWQIHNVFDLKNKIEKIDIIEQTLKKQQKDFEEFTNYTKCENLITIAELREKAKDYDFAFMYAMESLTYGVLVNSRNISYILTLLCDCEGKIKKGHVIPQDTYERIVAANDKITKTSCYHSISLIYESVYNSMINKIVKSDKFTYE